MYVTTQMKWFLTRLGRKRSCALLIVISVIACLRYTSWLASPNRVAPERSTEETLNKQFPSPEPPIRRWVVIAGKNTSCDRLALKFVNWMILVVDGGSQQSSNSRCVTLNQSDVERIPPELLLSAKRHSRLLAAYLYAIQHGAQVILPITVPGDVSTVEPPKHTTTIGPQTGLVPTFGGIVFDVAAHFGCNGTSRGKQPSYALSYSLCRRKVAAIQTTAACSSVHTSVSSSSSPVCDAHAPPVALANERFAPVHLEDALYTIDAFWALPGMLVADSVDKYMWSLAVQRLLWLSGNQVVVQRCSTSLSETANNRLFHAATQMNEWHCSSTTIKQCILDLIASSFGRDAITLAYSHWLDALHKSGYAFPQFSHTFNDKCENVKLHAVDHSVPLSRRPLGGGVHTPITNLDSITKVYEETCHNPNITLPMNVHVNVAQPWTQFDDVLFLVIFNNPHYEVIPYIETLYRPFFPNILYCGPDMFDVNRYPNIKQFTISFVSFGSNRRGYVAGAFTQKCMMLALQMDYSVKGYLAVADDQLLVVHTLAYLKRSKVWFEKNIHVGDLNNFKECKLDRYKKYVCATNFQYAKEHWWKVYRNETLNALAELAHSRNSSKIVDACYQRLLSKNGAADRANGAFSDIYYIPSSRSQDFIKLVDIFLHHNVMVEVAVPMIIRCFAASKDVHPLLSEKWRGEIRNEPWKLIKTKNLVGKGSFHPVKWGFLSRGSAKYTSLFCTTILPFLHDRSAGRVKRKV